MFHTQSTALTIALRIALLCRGTMLAEYFLAAVPCLHQRPTNDVNKTPNQTSRPKRNSSMPPSASSKHLAVCAVSMASRLRSSSTVAPAIVLHHESNQCCRPTSASINQTFDNGKLHQKHIPTEYYRATITLSLQRTRIKAHRKNHLQHTKRIRQYHLRSFSIPAACLKRSTAK